MKPRFEKEESEVHATGAARARRAGFDRQRVSQLPLEPNPVLVRQAQQRTKSIENRVADRITAFAGSMPFVWQQGTSPRQRFGIHAAHASSCN